MFYPVDSYCLALEFKENAWEMVLFFSFFIIMFFIGKWIDDRSDKKSKRGW